MKKTMMALLLGVSLAPSLARAEVVGVLGPGVLPPMLGSGVIGSAVNIRYASSSEARVAAVSASNAAVHAHADAAIIISEAARVEAGRAGNSGAYYHTALARANAMIQRGNRLEAAAQHAERLARELESKGR